QNLSSSYEGFGSLVRSADLLKRMVHGEENLPEIFSLFESSYILVQSKSLQPVHIPAFETIMMLRILYHLGYWSADDEYWLVQDPVTLELLDRITERVPQYMTTIRRSLNMSHL
ncbi:MAG: hypothetical protein OEX08_01690, partial [Candidatus Nomurabacteria bacterium]|nr:hypothetical protein [Candidatus Nomurabacteria bacterium]